MKKKNFIEKQIALTLHQAERKSIEDVTHHLGISSATFHQWKSKFGSPLSSKAKRWKMLEEENLQLEQLVGKLSLDKKILPMRLFIFALSFCCISNINSSFSSTVEFSKEGNSNVGGEEASSPPKEASSLSREDVRSLIPQASQGDKAAQQHILDYYQGMVNRELLLSSPQDLAILKELALEQWESYLNLYHDTFATLCIRKGKEDRSWSFPEKVKEQITAQAKEGNARAQCNLGLMYYLGQGVEEDDQQAFYWYKRAAEQGDVRAQYSLGTMYLSGQGVEQDEQQAFYWYKRAAEQGNANAQYNLGVRYDKAKGVNKDNEKALYWYILAAQQGYPDAQYNLGIKYNHGQGVEKDETQAFYWWRKAAEQGDAGSQYNLGTLYGEGRGVEKDETQAFYWWHKAAEQGYTDAQYNLGIMYDIGQGVEQDETQAFYWWRKAAEQGHVLAQFNVGIIYNYGRGVERDETQAFHWWHKAAEQGQANAQYNLGMMYNYGLGVRKNETQASYWWHKAAEQGHAEAQYNLGVIYKYGYAYGRISQDRDQALRWYILAAQKGIDKAREDLRKITKKKEAPLEENAKYIEDIANLRENVQSLLGLHRMEAMLNNPASTVSAFKEKELAIPSLNPHYENILNLEEKVLDVLKDLSYVGYLVDGWGLKNASYRTEHRGKDRYYEAYDFEGATYLCLGKEAVEKGDKLMSILKGEDQEWEAALSSIGFLEKVLKSDQKSLLGKAINLQRAAREEESINREALKTVLELLEQEKEVLVDHQEGEKVSFKKQEECLDELEEIKKFPKYLGALLRQGASHRNQLFSEEYPFLN